MPHPCPIVQGTPGNHGDERAPRDTTAPDRIAWSGAVHLRGGCTSGFRCLLRDRDSRYTQAFDAAFTCENIAILKGAPRAPKMNARTERFIRSVRAERTDRMLIYNEQHARRILAEYAEHYSPARPHRALQLRAPVDDPDVIPFPAQHIQRHDVLSGLIHEYRDTA
ncbi:integrase core domain-containing protein [Streptomyces sp. NPDC001792]|uniref:integrase core domain-containing protein n=1 Tax=Streptomyces sp. NPDC001792 TaxID=3154524 RepID=UPI0033282B13